MSPGTPSVGIADKERGIGDRGTVDMTIPAIVNRLTRFALRYYGKKREMGLDAPVVFTETELALIKTTETDREGEWFRTENKFNEYYLTLYERDVKEFAWIIKREFPSHLRNALRQNEMQVKEIQNEALSNETLRGIHLDARTYFDVLKQKRSETSVTRTGGVAEGRQSIVEAPRGAVKEIDNPWLTVLFSADSNLLGTLAESEVAARKALEALFKRTLEDIHRFRQAILIDQDPIREPSPIWRYPPIVVEIVSKYSDSRHLQRFAVDMIAQPRAQGLLGRPELKVGLLLFGLAGLIVTTGPVGVVLAVTDFGLAAIDTYQSYMRERENDLAKGASLLGQGAIFTERQSDYTGVFGSLAATLLSGFFLLKMIPRSRILGHLPEARAKGSPAEQAIEQAEKGKSVGKEVPPDTSVSNEARSAKQRSTSDRGAETRPEPADAISKKAIEDTRNVDKQIKPEERSISNPKVNDQSTLNRSAEPVEATKGELPASDTKRIKKRGGKPLAEATSTKYIPPIVEGGADPRTARTGGIRRIFQRITDENTTEIVIEGKLLDPIPRNKASNFNDELQPSKFGVESEVPKNYQALHLWGPRFGDEAAAGIMHGPLEFNTSMQSRAEKVIQDLYSEASVQGGDVFLKAVARSHNRMLFGGNCLAEVEYFFNLLSKDGKSLKEFYVTMSVGPPPKGRIFGVEVREF